MTKTYKERGIKIMVMEGMHSNARACAIIALMTTGTPLMISAETTSISDQEMMEVEPTKIFNSSDFLYNPSDYYPDELIVTSPKEFGINRLKSRTIRPLGRRKKKSI